MAAKRRVLSTGGSFDSSTVQVVSVAASDEDHIIASISLSEESIDQITRLFKIIDRNHDGTLDTKDFSLAHDKTGEQFKKWTELRDKFDFDGDGCVTLSEFQRGFKKMVLKLACTVVGNAKEMTIEAYLRELGVYINEQVQELCKSAFLWYSH